jgi:hypothetical protein
MPWREPDYPGEFPSLGWGVVEWIEDSLTVPDGESQGAPLKLTDEMVSFLVRFYRLDPVTCRRVYRRGVLVRPKGWGKSPFEGGHSLAELAGPVVPDGFDAAGEPVGRPRATPWVQIASVSEDSTDNTWSSLYQMAQDGTLVEQVPGLDVGITRIYLPGGGRCEPVTSSSGSREGQRITFAVLDETHLWTPTNGGVKLAATLRRNLAKMSGSSVETTNAPFLGEQSVAEATIEGCRRGGAKARGILFDHREAPETDLTDTAALLKSLQFVYGDSFWIDLQRLIEEIADPDTDPDDARRFYLNQVRAAADRAFDRDRWKELARPDVVVEDKTPIVAGFDGSRFDDATALIGTVIATGHQFVLGMWEKPPGPEGDGWEVPVGEVNAAVDDTFSRFKVWRLYADPPYWEDVVAAWVGRYGDQRVIEWWTHRDRQVAFALRAYKQAMTASEITHDGDPVLTRHIGNAVRRRARARDDDGRPMWTIGKPARQSPYKIDAAMAGCLSWEARRDAVAAGAANQVRRRIVVGR